MSFSPVSFLKQENKMEGVIETEKELLWRELVCYFCKVGLWGWSWSWSIVLFVFLSFFLVSLVIAPDPDPDWQTHTRYFLKIKTRSWWNLYLALSPNNCEGMEKTQEEWKRVFAWVRVRVVFLRVYKYDTDRRIHGFSFPHPPHHLHFSFRDTCSSFSSYSLPCSYRNMHYVVDMFYIALYIHFCFVFMV